MARGAAGFADLGPGPEMGKWKKVAVDAEIDIFFCDPHARGKR